jgi:hypothetical protein
MKLIYAFGLLFFAINTVAQNGEQIIFQPKFQSESLALNKAYVIDEDTVRISNFRCYITDLSYFKNEELVRASSKKVHLIDATDCSTFSISENELLNFDEIRFNIGVDSLTNVSGVYEGDLDPAKGMYWTWQSGYVNLKIEGTSSLCPARKNKFYWHIGGYLPPYTTLRSVKLKIDKSNHNQVFIQLDKLFEEIDVFEVYQVMSPNDKAMQIADKLPLLFKTAH